MKRFLVVLALALSSPITMLAEDYSNRGRFTDFPGSSSNDNFDGILAILFFACIVGVVLYYVAKEIWSKYKDEIIGSLVLIGAGIIVFLFLCWAVKSCKSTDNTNSNIDQTKFGTVEQIAPQAIEKDHTNSWVGYPKASKPKRTKENDFLVAVINNPSYNIYDLIMVAGLNSYNTQFLTEKQYASSRYIRKKYTPARFHKIYVRLSKAWKLFLICQSYDLKSSEIEECMNNYSTWDVNKPNTSQTSNPRLIRALKVVPLDL